MGVIAFLTPSLKRRHGFSDHHTELSLRHSESVDHGRAGNATPSVVQEYLKVLKKTLEENALRDKPHLIFNCDEAIIHLNKSNKHVLVPQKTRHCNMKCVTG